MYLNSGNNPPTNLKNQYGIYSESYNEVDTTSWDDNTIREIYEHEVFCVAKFWLLLWHVAILPGCKCHLLTNKVNLSFRIFDTLIQNGHEQNC